ncbi:MAG: TetR/AcrR family transcriptional regulator [Lachnospiraceae bacterium]
MSDRAEQKKQFIVDRAREVFARKGFRCVTMKDIVEACGISRGGLYLYFESTEELFREVMRQDAENPDEDTDTGVTDQMTPAEIFAFFLKEQKKELLGRKDSLTVATYEYYFANKMPKKDNLMHTRYQSGLKAMEHLIRACVDSGEFICEDPKATALNIMLAIEGLRIASQTMGITESVVDREFVYLLQNLTAEE